MKPNELAVCGLAAVRALFAKDAAAIKRLFFDYPTGRKIGVMCKALAGSRRIYRCVEPAELEKIAGTVHHGGIVAVIDQRLLRPPRPEDLRALGARTRAAAACSIALAIRTTWARSSAPPRFSEWGAS